jgi:DNA-directed RNA polymerase specialized sigma24 family protein
VEDAFPADAVIAAYLGVPDPARTAKTRGVKESRLVPVTDAVADLPARQRIVITLRDIEGCGCEEVCTLLEISAADQRVLLHRARAAVRHRLEEYFSAQL